MQPKENVINLFIMYTSATFFCLLVVLLRDTPSFFLWHLYLNAWYLDKKITNYPEISCLKLSKKVPSIEIKINRANNIGYFDNLQLTYLSIALARSQNNCLVCLQLCLDRKPNYLRSCDLCTWKLKKVLHRCQIWIGHLNIFMLF